MTTKRFSTNQLLWPPGPRLTLRQYEFIRDNLCDRFGSDEDTKCSPIISSLSAYIKHFFSIKGGKTMNSLVFIARRWSCRSTHYTFLSCTALIDGIEVQRIDLDYDSGAWFEDKMFQVLFENDLVTEVHCYENGSIESPFSWCHRHNVNFYSEVINVQSKKDL